MSEFFPKPNSLVENVKVGLVCLIMQQIQIQKMQQELIHHLLLKKNFFWRSQKSIIDKLDIDKL